jgi:hypothetical protein
MLFCILKNRLNVIFIIIDTKLKVKLLFKSIYNSHIMRENSERKLNKRIFVFLLYITKLGEGSRKFNEWEQHKSKKQNTSNKDDKFSCDAKVVFW